MLFRPSERPRLGYLEVLDVQMEYNVTSGAARRHWAATLLESDNHGTVPLLHPRTGAPRQPEALDDAWAFADWPAYREAAGLNCEARPAVPSTHDACLSYHRSHYYATDPRAPHRTALGHGWVEVGSEAVGAGVGVGGSG